MKVMVSLGSVLKLMKSVRSSVLDASGGSAVSKAHEDAITTWCRVVVIAAV